MVLLLRFVPVCVLACGLSLAADPVPLANRGLSVSIDGQTGQVRSLTNRLTGESYQLKSVPFRLETSAGVLAAAKAAESRTVPGGVEFRYDFPAARVVVRYLLPPDQDFLRKWIEVTNTVGEPLVLHQVVPGEMEFVPALRQIYPHRDPSELAWPINLFLRGEKGGFYAGIENPIFQYWTRGSGPFPPIPVSRAASWVQLNYWPHHPIAPGATYVSDAMFLGSFKKERVYVFKELAQLMRALAEPKAVPAYLNFDQVILDWGEVWAMQDFIRAIQPPQDRPGFYARAVGLLGGRKMAEQGEAAGFHIPFAAEHVAGSRELVDEVARLGHIQHIEWPTEWFGAAGYANPSPGLAVENAGPGDPAPVSPHWEEVVRYGWEKGIRTGIFETILRNFARRKTEWKLRRRDGSFWTATQPPDAANCWANREYAAWRMEETSRAIDAFKLDMVTWDGFVPADWSWIGWPEMRTECFADNHGHLPGDIRYPIFRNIVWFLDELQARHPQTSLRVASGMVTAFPWALKNMVEYHANVFDGETGASFWTSWNFRFLPMYKSGVQVSAKTRAEFEWLLLRSISVSDHLFLWPDALGVALENRAFWHRWLGWADENIRYLRVGRTLFREPWGDNIVASMRPALEGVLPAPSAGLHGSAHVIGDRGYLFVFNPSSGPRTGAIPLNHWIGLTGGERFAVRVFYPGPERVYGPYRRGEELRITAPAKSVLVIEVLPASGTLRASRPRVSANAPVDKAFLAWEDIPWGEINPRP